MPDEIVLPARGWRPRGHQDSLWRYLKRGGKRAYAIWHRRAGKDDIALNHTACSIFERVGTYWHMLPEAAQARKAIWDAVDPHAHMRRIDMAFPVELRETTREQDMLIRFKNGSTWQVLGSDNYNSLVGSPPVGVVFSEWALAHPAAWAYLRPILKENGGWAVFITTPRGRNHAYDMFREHEHEEDWFVERLGADQTGALTADELEKERRDYIADFGIDVGEALYRQEYLCDWSAAVLGSYWGRELSDLERFGRIGEVPHEPLVPVYTAWDLGVGDSTAIWWFQVAGSEIRIIDFYQSHGVGLDHYAKVIRGKPWGMPAADFVPHDAKVREWGNKGRTRIEAMLEEKLSPRLVTDHKLQDGINAARRTLPHCWFDAERCAKGLEALRQYHADWDEKARTFRDMPKHDWTSHAADAFRYLAMCWREAKAAPPPPAKGKSLREMTWNDLMDAHRAQSGAGVRV